MGILPNLFFLSLCLTLYSAAGDNEHHDEHHSEHHGLNKDPYTEVLELFNISSEHSFTLLHLEELVHKFVDRLSCIEDAHSNQNCSDSFCLNVSSLITRNGGNISSISEETFMNISIVLLDLAVKPNKSCHEVVDVDDDFVTYKNRLLSRLTNGDVTEGSQVLELQEHLENVFIDSHDEIHMDHNDHDHDTDHEHDDGDNHDEDHHEDEEDHHEDEEDHHEDDEDHHEAEEDHHEDEEHDHEDEEHDHEDGDLLFQEKCLGADIVFDQMGIALDEDISSVNIENIAGLIVYHIVNGANISRDCRLLPRRDFFFGELDHSYGYGNKTLGTKGLSEVMEALEIGDVHAHAQSETEEHDHASHRRKRSTDMDVMLHKGSWESTCYTDEQILAIYQVDGDDDLSEETFSSLCPALIHQKLSGACVGNEGEAKKQDSGPSTAEKYGYGSIATIIVCLCSVVGAVVVKFTSDRAYDIIMALFIGLAVGTLFTDSMIHLIPMALGVHGHSADDHDHDHGSGIVIEEYVWYSLAACGALYFFYLFEKTLTLVRGQHTHSHGFEEDEEDKHEIQINISKADKYSMESISKDDLELKERKSKKPTSTVAVMILMGDAVHNFADGVAIGAAFSSSLTLGLSTSIAVFCHELPHELGDFAILLASGLSFGRALFLNVIVSLTAMLGLYVGLAVSDDEAVRQWIVAVAAGLFIYISLVDMMPQMLRRTKHGIRDFILNNVGMLLGAGAMLLLAIFEEKIKVSV